MGHDITAYRKSGGELSYLRISAFNRLKAFLIYESLNASECDGGVSGDGSEKEFTAEQVMHALAKLKYIAGETKEKIMEEVFSCNSDQAISDGLKMFGSLFGFDPTLPGECSEKDIKFAVEDVERFLKDCQGHDVRIEFN